MAATRTPNMAEVGEQLRRLAAEVEQSHPVGHPPAVRIAIALRRISYEIETAFAPRTQDEEHE